MDKIAVENIYYLGPDGSNTYNAVLKYLKIANIEVKNFCPQQSIKKVFECIKNDSQALCILPIENSIQGMVRETIDNFISVENPDIKIQAEINLPIKHNLLAKTDDKTKIKTIMSHRQALTQCLNYLYKEFENVEQKEVSSTSYAAHRASESDGEIAAIANETCANLFGLKILAKDINDEEGNTTRFYVISGRELEKGGNGKTAILFTVKNESG
ncbi:prephenate dehydratase, partial [bacterium]|nr:prephenate dehydratase [bacterium]